MSDTIVSIPDNGNNMNGMWPLLAVGNGGFGGLGGNNFWGAGIGGFFGSALGNLIGRNGGLLGGNGNGAGAAAALGAQATALNNTDLVMSAITAQGERSHEAVQTLSTMLGQDFNQVNSAVQTMQTALATIAANQGMNTMQVINAIQSGNMGLQQQFCQCCCDMRQTVTNQGYENQLRTVEQTNILGNAIGGVQQSVASKAAADQLAMCQQTYTLTDTMNRNYLALDNKIDAMESARKDRVINDLTAKLTKVENQGFTQAVVAQALAPIQAQLATIMSKMPSTVPVIYPQLTVTESNSTTTAGN